MQKTSINNQKEKLPLNDTRASILTFLLGNDLTAINLEEKLGINESAVRRHLDILQEKGYIDHYFEKAKRGRPKKYYTITNRGRKLFPQKSYLLFTLLIEEIEEDYGEEKLDDLLSEVASKFVEKYTPDSENKLFEKKINEFVNFLEEFGFYPSLKKEEEGSYTIEYKNCVFGDVVDKIGDRLCDMHKKMVKLALPEAEINLEKTFARGSKTCTHRIKLKES